MAANREQLEKALVVAYDAGDMEAVRVIATELQRQPATKEAAKKPPKPKGTPLAAVGEVAAMAGSAAIAEPVAGIAGLLATPFTGAKGGAETVERVRNAMTYQPRTQTAQNYLGDVADLYTTPIPGINESLQQGVEGVTNFFADRGADLLSPFGGQGKAVGHALGTAAPTAAGLIGGGRAVRPLVPDSAPKPRVDPRIEAIRRGDTDAANYTINERGKVKKSKPGKDAQYQGMQPGMVAAVRAVSPKDRRAARKMVEIVEAGKKNLLKGATLYPSQVAGESITKRVKHVADVNRRAGSEINAYAKQSLPGVRVDYEPAVNRFIAQLDDLDIGFDPQTLKLNFEGSQIQGLGGNEATLRRVVEWMKNAKSTDALGVHKLKRYLDENIEGGKAEGATRRVQNVLKGFRHDLKEMLEEASPAYAKANKKYSETRQVLDDFQSAVGKNTDFKNPRQIGIESRKIVSNYRSGTSQLDGLKALTEIANKYGGAFDDDVVFQVKFFVELQRLFPDTFRTTFKADIEKAVETVMRGKEGVTNAVAGKVTEAILGRKGEAEALDALKRLLDEPVPRLPKGQAAQQRKR